MEIWITQGYRNFYPGFIINENVSVHFPMKLKKRDKWQECVAGILDFIIQLFKVKLLDAIKTKQNKLHHSEIHLLSFCFSFSSIFILFFSSERRQENSSQEESQGRKIQRKMKMAKT